MIPIAPAHPLVPVPVPIARALRELPDVVTLELDVSASHPAGFAWKPGQFNMLYAHGLGEVPISIMGARAGRVLHTIREVGAVTRALGRLKRGDHIGLRGPFGTAWPIDEAEGRDVLFVAGGLGLAPLRPAIERALAARDRYGRVAVLYGARSPADLLFREEIERWRRRPDAQIEVTVDRAGEGFSGKVGVVPDLVAEAEIDPARAVVMICGPEVMMRFTVRALVQRGVPLASAWVSMERNMKCAVGLCGHCQWGARFVCKDGPVFRFDRVDSMFFVREL